MLTLYGSPGSGSAAVEAGLDIAGLAYRTVDAASWKPSSPGLDELRRINPIAQIPTLALDDGSILTESAAILIHLGLAHPPSGLLATDEPQRAQQIRGLVYIGANCYAAIGILDFPDRWYPDPDDAVKKAMQTRGRARLHELWEIFADQFPATPWLSGNRLGALDVLAATVSKWGGAGPNSRRPGPRSMPCSGASKQIPESPRCGRGTGRRLQPPSEPTRAASLRIDQASSTDIAISRPVGELACGSPRMKAIRRPSGDQAGKHDGSASKVSCWRAVPSTRMTQS